MDVHLLLAVFHIAFVVPLFLFVGYNRAATPEWLYNVVFALGLIVTGYHGFKAAIRLMAKSAAAWVNLIHALLIGPLMIYIGFLGKKTQRPAYEMLLIAAFGALGYHLSTLVVLMQTFTRGATAGHD